jgi:hypothetical protein
MVIAVTIVLCPSIDKSNEKMEPGRHPAAGILPQLGVAMHLPEDFRLYDPDGPRPPDERIEYNRTFPIWGEDLINRGYALPRPIGLSIIGVDNTQDQGITELNLKLGKGAVPPRDEVLRPFPAVTIDSSSATQSVQLKADVWLLPFLNVFASLGKVTGDASLSVNIDLADAPELCIPDPRPTLPRDPPRPPICTDNEFSGSFLLPIKSDINPTTATIGLSGAFSVGKWFGAVTGSYTESYGDKASDVSNINAGLRAGRRLIFGRGHLFTPFFGINYLDIDTRVQGVATLMDAFPDDDDLNVRYDVQLDNTDKYSGILGLGMGFTNGMGVQFEWNKSSRSERFVLSGEIRF